MKLATRVTLSLPVLRLWAQTDVGAAQIREFRREAQETLEAERQRFAKRSAEVEEFIRNAGIALGEIEA